MEPRLFNRGKVQYKRSRSQSNYDRTLSLIIVKSVA
jgi:hypothetical protein